MPGGSQSRLASANTTGPRLYGHLLLNAASFDLYSHFNRYTHELDEASGRHFHLVTIGDPGQLGDHFAAAHPRLASGSEYDGAQYVENIFKAGREPHHVLKEMGKLATRLDVSPGQLPCIAFCTASAKYALTILEIEEGWWETVASWKVFVRLLQAWFSSPSFKEAVISDLRNPRMVERLDAEVEGFSNRVRESIAAEAEGSRVGSETLVFRKEGKTWRVVYGGKSASVPAIVGMEYLARLLQNPGQDIETLRLRALRAGVVEPPAPGSAGELLDKRAIRDYEERLRRTERQIDRAEQDGNAALVEKLKQDQQALYAELGRGVGLRGRQRRGADDADRARRAVSTALQRAIKAIKQEHPQLGQHLTNCVRMGQSCSYTPDRRMCWAISIDN